MKYEFKIDELLDSEGFNDTCNDCKYYREFYEAHPYGSTYAYETLAECDCPEDSKCPRLNDNA